MGGSAPARMSVNATALYVGGITATSSDKRLKFNEKPLNHALEILSRLEHVAYSQTHDLTAEYSEDPPQSHQCGFKAQSVQRIDELTYVAAGVVVGEGGQESITHLNAMLY